jgi:predicted dehydrogenase
MKTFSIGVVGAGVIARQVHLPVLRSMRNVRLVWIADADPNRARAAAEANRLEHFPSPASPAHLPDCDVALLAIPVGARPAYYEGLSRRGIAVFAEKPFAATAEEHRWGMSLFSPDRVACGYMRRMYASSSLLKRVIASNLFGPVRRVCIREGGRTSKTGADQSHYDDVRAAGGGVLISLGCHDVDLALHITGATHFEVLDSRLVMDGLIDRKVECRVRLDGVGNAHGLADQSERSCLFELTVSWLDEQPNTVEVEFDTAVLSASLQPAGLVEVSAIKASNDHHHDMMMPTSRDPAPSLLPILELRRDTAARTTNQAFYLEWSEFLHALEEGRPSGIAAATSLRTAEMIDELYARGGFDRSSLTERGVATA